MKLYRLENNDVKVDISPIGASIVNFFMKNKDGHDVNIVLGYDNEDQYRSNGTYIGAVVGPIANRVSMGCFTLDGTQYSLTQNDGTNHLHGGAAELNSRCWEVIEHSSYSMLLSLVIDEGKGGYPCDIAIQVAYKLNDENELEIEYTATPQSRCPINITQHAYFNLNGTGDILQHQLRIDADTYLAVDENLIPIESQDVSGTPFDFTCSTLISDSINQPHSQIKVAGGFDHCWVLNHKDYSMDVYSDQSGIRLQAKTDLPGVQFYSGNFLEKEQGRNGDIYERNSGLCLETQHFPDQVNSTLAEECIYSPDRPFSSCTVYKVSRD